MEKIKNNLIVRFSVTGLFGLYDYDLRFPVDEDEKITFLTGPNGYGKTTILNIIYYMLIGRKYWPIDKGCTNFQTATITFENGDTITATPAPNSVHYYNADGQELTDKLPLNVRFISSIPNGHTLPYDKLNPDDTLFDRLEKDFYLKPDVRNHPACASHGEANLIQLFDVLTDDDQPPLPYLLIDSVDEGMHVAWQLKLSENIKNLRPETQAIYATHAPYAINERWADTVDLFSVLNNEEADYEED